MSSSYLYFVIIVNKNDGLPLFVCSVEAEIQGGANKRSLSGSFFISIVAWLSGGKEEEGGRLGKEGRGRNVR